MPDIQNLIVFAVGVVVFLGIYLLVQRGREAARRKSDLLKGASERERRKSLLDGD